MSICWYCHWGWPKLVADIYDKAVKALDGDKFPLSFGPSHIVWEDENFDAAERCLEHFDEWKGDFSLEDLEIVRTSLKELAAIPLHIRDCEPDDYDGENPGMYPPSKDMVMVKR